jgi:hypothetical protein
MYQEHDEYEEARRLLAPLASEPTRPSRVDIQRAIADGRRRVRTRRLAAVGAVAAVTALVVAGVPAALAAVRAPEGPPVASGQPSQSPSPSPSPTYPVPTTEPEPAPEPPTSCELELPPVPAEAWQSIAFGADPTGRIVYGRYYLPGGYGVQPVLWIDGELVPVDIPGNDASIAAVNSSGVAVGTSIVGEGEDDHTVAWMYRDGAVTELAGDDARPVAIAEDGTVIGTVSDGGVPVMWRSPDAPPEQLPNPTHAGAWQLSTILPDGTVVGFRDSEYERSFVWWPDGTVQKIPRPEVDGEVFGFRAHGLNGGVLVGLVSGFDANGNRTGRYTATYDLTSGEFTILSQDAPIKMWAMNRHGWIAGEADGYAGLWTPEGGLLTLPDLGIHNEYTPNLPHWVADDGRTITGAVEEVEGQSLAAVWRCG